MFCVANALFLTRVGPRAKLDGRYVRFCLQLERERFYRRMIIAYCVCLVGFMVLGFLVAVHDPLLANSSQLSDAMELVLIVMASVHNVAASAPSRRAAPRWRGRARRGRRVELIVNDLMAARARRRSRPEDDAARLARRRAERGKSFQEVRRGGRRKRRVLQKEGSGPRRTA